MKKTVAVISALMLTFTLAACSSNYVMHTNDGRTIVTPMPTAPSYKLTVQK